MYKVQVHRKKQSFAWLLASGLALSVLVTGCGQQSAAPQPAVSEQAGKSDQAQKQDQTFELNVGYGQSLGTQLGFIAEYEGYFKEQNLKVNFVPFASTADGLNGLQAGKIDVGVSFGTAGPLTFISQGSDFSIIGGHLSGGSPVYAKKENQDQFKTIEGFRGKKVGTLRLYTGDIVFRSALSQAGIDWKKDIELIEFKNNSMLLEAIKSGKVDVGVGSPGTLYEAEEGGLVAVTWSNDLQPDHVCCRIVAKTGDVKEKREAFKRFLKAIIKAERDKEKDPKVTIDASRPHIRLDDKIMEKSIIEPHMLNHSDPNKKEIVKMWENMNDIGYIKEGKDIDITKYIDTSLYKEAVEELIASEPDEPFFQKVKERFNQQNIG